MRTIGKDWPQSARGSGTASCDYCGVAWPRNKLRRDRSGHLFCPDEGCGADRTALDEGNALGASRKRPGVYGDEGRLLNETFTATEYTMTPVTGRTVYHPHTGALIPAEGVVAEEDLHWSWLRQQGQITYEAAP